MKDCHFQQRINRWQQRVNLKSKIENRNSLDLLILGRKIDWHSGKNLDAMRNFASGLDRYEEVRR